MFDWLNLGVATFALIVAGVSAYWQIHKVDRLSFSLLSFGFVNLGNNDPRSIVKLTFALANTGSLPEIVSHLWLSVPRKDQGAAMQPGTIGAGGTALVEPILVTPGGLVQASAHFGVVVDQHSIREQGGKVPVLLIVEMVRGSGEPEARTLKGLYVVEDNKGRLGGTVYPNAMTVKLLPKPATDRTIPTGYMS